MNQGYWHKCVCFTCRKVGSKGQSSEKSGYKNDPILEMWPICSRCNKKMVMCGPNFKAPKYNNIKRWKYLQTNWNSIRTYDDSKESIKILSQVYKKIESPVVKYQGYLNIDMINGLEGKWVKGGVNGWEWKEYT
jgi:hypothetical protein